MAFSDAARNTFQTEIEGIRSAGLFKQERYIHSPQSSEIEVEFPVGAEVKKCINICANNYLGLSSHPEVIAAAHAGLDARGYGMSSVRFICGTQDIHRQLENRLTEFLGTEDTLLFASVVDGMRLAKASQDTFKHSDMGHLEEKLQEHQDKRLRMIITDGIFSMDGDTARLTEMVALADKYDAMVFVDDSHATGFIGKTGRGTHEQCGVFGQIDVISTTLGKALGGASGGCISGRKELVEMCRQRARPFLFSNAVAPVIVAGALKVLDIISASTERRDKLEWNARYWRGLLKEAGFDIKDGDSPIVPVMLYDAKLAQDFARDLFAEGIYAVGFFFPVVPKGQARIRTQLSAAHEQRHLDAAIAAFKKVGEKYGVLGMGRRELMARMAA
jgi:glycine C-acetyltransferase